MGKMIFGKLLGIMLGLAILAGPVSAVTQSGVPLGFEKSNVPHGISGMIERNDLAQSIYCEHDQPDQFLASVVANKAPDLLLRNCCNICGAITVKLRNSVEQEITHSIYDIVLTPVVVPPVFSLLKPPRA